MSNGNIDQILVEMNETLDRLPSTPSEPSIFRVDNNLRTGGWDNVYDPEILSIGPYHYRKSHLQNMEQHKYMYLKKLITRQNEQCVDKYVTAARSMEKRARKCYAEPIDLDEDEFVKMIVLDGCFLIELLRYHGLKNLRDFDDPIFRHERILSQIRHDIMLLENQLPFFVLSQLFIMSKTEDSSDDIIVLTLRFLDGMFLSISVAKAYHKLPTHNVDHIFSLIHEICCLCFAEKILEESVGKDASETSDNMESISELREVGIRVEKAKENGSLMDIQFVEGVLRIPPLNIFDETESQLRNMVTYEQYFPVGKPRYVSDYTLFMHRLMKTPQDVKLLQYCGIIGNWLGDDEDVYQMFNGLGKNIIVSSKFSYSRIIRRVRRHCNRRPNRWKWYLRKNYFSHPWSIISFIAAIGLLILTLLQTLFTMLSYYETSGKLQSQS